MCVALPVAAQIALTIGSGVAQLASQAQAAKAQAKAQEQASLNEAKRFQHEVSAARLGEAQQDTADAMEALKGNREADEAIATIITSGAERGIEGNATGLAVANYMMMNANYQTALEQQARMNRQGLSLGLIGATLGSQQNLVNINQPIAGPDYLGVALGTARQSLDYYTTGQLQQGQRDLYAQTAALRTAEAGPARQAVTTARGSRIITQQTASRLRVQQGARAAGR